jgi:hypothetical protein
MTSLPLDMNASWVAALSRLNREAINLTFAWRPQTDRLSLNGIPRESNEKLALLRTFALTVKSQISD